VKFRQDVSPSRLRQLFDLDGSTGRLLWRRRPEKSQYDKIWNARFAGRDAGTLTGGYRQVCIDYRLYKVHRVIFAIAHGEWPSAEVDHRNRDGLNNSVGDLRDASHAENQRNSKLRSTNKSGAKGVCWDARRRKWQAYINAGRRIHLGRFESKAEAIAAANAARIDLHGEFARLA
jgi:hypothetical protein